MPRSAILYAPGVFHHITIRGIERRKIFIDNKNRDDFPARLENFRLRPKRHITHGRLEGLHQGRREDFVGEGLIRSLDGWSAAKATGLQGSFMKSDEMILGDGDFVGEKLLEAQEKFERKYAMKRQEYDLDKVAQRAAALCAVEVNDIFSGNKQPARVKARSFFCYWASGALGVSYAALAGRIGITAPGVGYSAERGKLIAQENGYQLL